MVYTPPALPYYGPVAHSSGTGNLPINRIVIHCTAGPGQVCAKGAQGTAGYFRTQASGGSAHYITDLDESIQCAHDNVVCWHAPPNPHSLGIEMECSLANRGQGHWVRADHVAMLHRTAKLTAQKCLQYNLPVVRLSVADLRAGKRGVCGHNEVSLAFGQSSHWDPGEYFPWTQFMVWVHEEYANLTGELDMAVADDILRELRALQADFNGFQALYSGRWAQEVGEARTQAQALQDKLDAIVADEHADDALETSRWALGVGEGRTQSATLLEKLDALAKLHEPTPPAPPPLP